MKKIFTKTTFASFCIVLLVLPPLSGCSNIVSAPNGNTFAEEKATAEKTSPLIDSWKEDLTHNDLSDFERDVLKRAIKTGKITQDDYEQAHSLYIQCMTAKGFDDAKYIKQPDGLYKLVESPRSTDKNSDTWWNTSIQCSTGTDSIIEAEYRDQQDNPERYKDQGIVAVQCLRDAGKVDDSYTAAQFNNALTRYDEDSQDGSLSKLFGFPVHSSDEQTIFCLSLGGLSLSGDF